MTGDPAAALPLPPLFTPYPPYSLPASRIPRLNRIPPTPACACPLGTRTLGSPGTNALPTHSDATTLHGIRGASPIPMHPRVHGILLMHRQGIGPICTLTNTVLHMQTPKRTGSKQRLRLGRLSPLLARSGKGF